MCQYISRIKPFVAKRDIEVYKALTIEDGKYKTPFQKCSVKLNSVLVPENGYVRPYVEEDEIEKTSLSKGVIYAYTGKSLQRGENIKFYVSRIPKGAEYFVSDDLETICSSELYISDTKVENISELGISESLIDDMLVNITDENANKEDAVAGDVVYSDLTIKHINEVDSYENIIGIVACIRDKKIYVTALRQAVAKWSTIQKRLLLPNSVDPDNFKNAFNGEEYTEKVRNSGNLSQYPAFQYCVKYGVGNHKWHLPDIGELWQMIHYNMLAINFTIHKLVEKGIYVCPILDATWYWASAEYSQASAWYCNANDSGVGYYYTKWDSRYVRPSLAIMLSE